MMVLMNNDNSARLGVPTIIDVRMTIIMAFSPVI
jgi:hypothetical protein